MCHTGLPRYWVHLAGVGEHHGASDPQQGVLGHSTASQTIHRRLVTMV